MPQLNKPPHSHAPQADSTEQQARTEARITELETRTAFQEDLMNTLNDVIANQDRQLATLSRKLDLLTEQLEQHGGSDGGSDSTAHEPPPHY